VFGRSHARRGHGARGAPIRLYVDLYCSYIHLRGFVFCPGGSAVWPQCWLCAVGHIGCCVGGEYPVGVSISSSSLCLYIDV